MEKVSNFLLENTLWKAFEYLHKKSARERLRNTNFTLITQNCIGGAIYNILGKRFDSPTINLYILQNDFCMFCLDLQYYLNCDLHFYEKPDITCPYAFLGEGDKRISIQFTHYKTENEAREKWNERKKRIHWDNLYIITNDGNDATVDNLNSLAKVCCKDYIVFTSKKRDEIINSFQLKSLKKYDTAVYMAIERDRLTGLRPWQKEFDYVTWLNGN